MSKLLVSLPPLKPVGIMFKMSRFHLTFHIMCGYLNELEIDGNIYFSQLHLKSGCKYSTWSWLIQCQPVLLKEHLFCCVTDEMGKPGSDAGMPGIEDGEGVKIDDVQFGNSKRFKLNLYKHKQ